MAFGHKTDGRQAGTPNRKTGDIGELLKALGCDPIEGMAKIAMDRESRPELRGPVYAEHAQYVYPKPRAIDGEVVTPHEQSA